MSTILNNIFQHIKQIYLKYEIWIKIFTFIYFIIDHFTLKWLTPLWNLFLPFLYPLWQKAPADWPLQVFLIAIFIQVTIIWIVLKYIPRNNRHPNIVSAEKTIPLQELPKEVITKLENKQFVYKSERFIKYLDVKWHIVEDIIEKAYYCPIHEAKLLPSKGMYICPMELCSCQIAEPLNSAYEKASSAIPAIIKKETKKRISEIVDFLQDNKNKYVEHAGVLWEYDKAIGKLNEDILCPMDKTPLLIYEDINKQIDFHSRVTGLLALHDSTHYCPKCNNVYLKNKSNSDIERMRKEVIAIIKGETKK
jgi:uncharacterized protein YbaR (Trm112 family)